MAGSGDHNVPLSHCWFTVYSIYSVTGGAAVCAEEVRRRQEREQQLNTKFASIHKKVL